MDKWLNQPTVLKIISLLIGIVMWAVVHFDSEKTPNTVAKLTETRDIDAVEIKPIGLDDKNYKLQLMDPGEVHLTVRGSRSDLLIASHNSEYQITVDLSKAVEGRAVLPVNVSLPRGLELIEARPSNVTVVLERLVTKEFDITINTTGTPGKGYKVGLPLVKPSGRAHVTLPADELNEVSFVGGTVSVQGQETTVNDKKLKLVALDKNGNELTDAVISPSVVEVEIPITQPYKRLPLQFGFTGSVPEGLAVSEFKPSVDAITIYGPQDVLDKYEFYDGLTIDLSQWKQSGTMKLDIQPGKDIATVDPPTVTIDYTVVYADTKLLPKVPVTLYGLSDGLKAKITLPTDGRIDATISGAPTTLAKIGVKDVQLVADLSNLGPGAHVVPVTIHLPQFVRLASLVPLSITVTITDGGLSATGTKDEELQTTGQPGLDGNAPDGTAGQGSSTNTPNGTQKPGTDNSVKANGSQDTSTDNQSTNGNP